MGMKIYLPPATRVDDVADVLGLLLGLPKRKEPLACDNDGAWFLKVEGANAMTGGVGLPACARVDCVLGGETVVHQVYHFETPRGERMLMPEPTPRWVALGRRLVDFFGGRLIYNDNGSDEADYEAPARDDIHEEDGPRWQAFEQRKWDVKPLTRRELHDARKFAACKD